MAKNGSKESVVELWGREFNLARNGLDEEQVVSFVNELIGERDLLIQRVEHLSALTKLAEKTVVEADRLAGEIKEEAVDQAKAEADAIVAKAEEQAQQVVEEKRTEIITIATKEVEAIKANAEREAELFIQHQRRKVQPELRDMAQRLYKELLSQLESLKQQVIALEVEFEHKLSQSAEQITPSASSEVSLEGAEDIPVESQQPTQTTDQTNTSEVEEKAPLSAATQGKPTYEEVELEILPPVDVRQIMGIMRYLDSSAEVENTELIPLTDRPLIIVSLREPMQLIEILGALPEVGQVKEVTALTGANHAGGKRRKIQITLSGNAALDEAKERLNSEVYNTLS